MDEVLKKDNINIGNKIHIINGVQVITDYDLAKIYETETKRINEAVSRNPMKFPLKYSWILFDEDSKNLLVAICDQNNVETRGGKFKNPRVFTEQAVAMLSTILKTPKAIQTSLAIMDAFVKMRHFLIDNKDIYKSIVNINNALIDHDEKLDYLFSKFDKKEQLFLENNEYDAYSSFVSIFKLAVEELIIVDSYADNTLLDIIRKLKCQVILITKNSDRLSNNEIDKYNKQYHNLKVIKNNSFHDRYFIIDKKWIYQSGTSINTAGDKIFSINKISDDGIKNILLEYISQRMN